MMVTTCSTCENKAVLHVEESWGEEAATDLLNLNTSLQVRPLLKVRLGALLYFVCLLCSSSLQRDMVKLELRCWTTRTNVHVVLHSFYYM